MRVLMLGNGFDLYHRLLSHYDDFMLICEHLRKKYPSFSLGEQNEISVFSELSDFPKENKKIWEKILVYEEAYKNTRIDKDEYVRFLEKLHSNCWFEHFLTVMNRDGWVALEGEVAKILGEFRKVTAFDVGTFADAIKVNYGYNEEELLHAKYTREKRIEGEEFVFEQFNEFIEILRQYLKIFVDSVLPNISGWYVARNSFFRKTDYVLTFNYTNTYRELYDVNAKTIHIHGKLDSGMVLGVNSDEYDAPDNDDIKHIKYKKYYQRITKHTLEGIKKLMTSLKNCPSYEAKGLLIVGHSLDKSDGDIIKVLFDKFDTIEIYFHNEEALDKYVKNLKIIFGSNELSEMTFSQKVIFKQLPPNEYLG